MIARLLRPLTWLILLSLLAGSLPDAAFAAPAPAVAAPRPGTARAPRAAIALPADLPTPVVPVQADLLPALPALAMELAVDPDPVAIGDTATLSVTLTNRAPAPGTQIRVTIPAPEGVLAVPGPGTVAPTAGWAWDVPQLDASASVTLVGQLRVTGQITGGAFVLRASATAAGVDLPFTASGGALVRDPALGPATARFTPGVGTTLRSSDGRVTVTVPGTAFDRPLTLQADRSRGRGRDSVRGRPTTGPIALTASDDQGADVHTFAAPLTLSMAYTPEELVAQGLDEATLNLFWVDAATGAWEALPTELDTTNHVATAIVSHFSDYNLSDGSSPSAAYIPSLQGFQVSLLTGAASYSIPIEVPAGPSGLKPSLSLSYSSASNDGSGGLRGKLQASWVGRGWSFDPAGSVSYNESEGSSDSKWDNFAFTFGGRSFDVVKGELLPGYTDYSDTNITHWSWHATDENFVRVRANTTPNGWYSWTAWTPDGTRYDFTEALRWGIESPPGSPTKYSTYKWLLKQVTDPHGNKIVYDYVVDPLTGAQTVHPTYHLSTISWAYDGATPRYQVQLTVRSRWDSVYNPTSGVDLDWEYTTARSFGKNGTPHEAYRLDEIQVLSKRAGASGYELIGKHKLTYAATAQSVTSDVTGGQRMLTLTNVQRFGKDGTTALPAQSFTYGMNQGNAAEPTPGWNRMLTATNGQGGKVTYTYAHVWTGAEQPNGYAAYYQNYYRVTDLLREDTSGQFYSKKALTHYDYAGAALNDYLYSAAIQYAQFPPSLNGDSLFAAAHQKKREFRGHWSVTERSYDGDTTGAPLLQTTEHWFNIGNGGTDANTCTPTILTDSGSGQDYVDTSTSCFTTMRDREALKGREFKTQVRNNAGAVLQETNHTFTRIELPFYGSTSATAGPSNHYRRAGLWRVFLAEPQTTISTKNGTASTVDKTTLTFYNQNCTTDTATTIEDSYGNVQCVQDKAGTTLIRSTKRAYVARDDSGYLVDRMFQEAIYNGSGNLIALTNNFHDSTTAANATPTIGELRRVSRYSNVPGTTTTSQGLTLSGSDTSYTYDSSGNRLTEVTYDTASTRTFNGTTTTWSALSGTTQTTTTVYDGAFHSFATQETNAAGHVTKADYDYRMGTLIRVTGPNSSSGTPTDCTAASFSIPAAQETSCAVYDVFGRMVKLVKPGDSTSNPTVLATYYDSESPFRYKVERRETSGQSGVLISQQFYDGLGRQVQTKTEGDNASNPLVNVVVDTQYDGLGRTTATSQARFVTETSTSFFQYTNPGASLFLPTSTSYDALGRITSVVAPLTGTTNRTSTTSYGVSGGRTTVETIDPLSHKVRRSSDALGRLVEVIEYTGTSSYSAYATTDYAYDALDRLSSVTDELNNVTSIGYDSLGRKTSMADPDMGTWYYAYDTGGNLTSQTDAKGQTTWYAYDALDRLTAKNTAQLIDAFDSKNTTNWTWNAQQTVPFNDGGSNVVKNVGTGTSYGAEFYRNAYSLRHNTSVWVRLKVDASNPQAYVGVEANDSTYRRFAVVAQNGTLAVHYIADGVNTVVAATLIGSLQLNTWYQIAIGLDDVGGFSALAYQESNPSIQGSYTTPPQTLPVGKTWRFHHWNYRNTAYLDTYIERNGAEANYTYDDTTSPNLGKGKRTSMRTNLGGVLRTYERWEYDARGRVTLAGQGNLGSGYQHIQTGYDAADRVTTQLYTEASETVTTTYDAAGKPETLCSSLAGQSCYVSAAKYNALGQPLQQTMENSLIRTASYSSPTARLSSISVTAGATSILNRSYGYDSADNITSLNDSTPGSPLGNQTFSYDERDRLKSWISALGTENYSYNQIGNLTAKAGKTYTYGAQSVSCPAGALNKPHAVINDGTTSYCYDANGNMVSGGSRTYTWDGGNLISSVNGSEFYLYDADGERVLRRSGSTTTVYFQGLWENVVGGATKRYYTFDGQGIAVRDSVSGLTYLHNDHLGSISASSTGTGANLSRQYFDPWGKVKSGGISATPLSYTGQRLDSTGLLYYHARYYDPGLGRFVSPDSDVPDAQNPQDFNRYSYVKNNPLRYTDPTGHCIPGIGDCQYTGKINWHDGAQFAKGVAKGAASVVMGVVTAPIAVIEAARNPAAAIEGVQTAAATVARGASFAWNNPSGAAAALNDDPEGVGKILGEAAATAGMGALAKRFGGEAANPCANSFTADTLVHIPQGSIPISTIVTGTEVLAFNESTGVVGVYPVTAIHRHVDPIVIVLMIGDEIVETTPEHPFFVLMHGWVEAGALQPGDSVRTITGTYGVVHTILMVQSPQVMYNLTVADAHTFFIGDEGWLVHNVPCRLPNGEVGQTLSDRLRPYPGRDGIIASGNGIRTVDQLVDNFGGRIKNWLKLKGEDYVDLPDGQRRLAELHWYQNGALQVWIKVKRYLD